MRYLYKVHRQVVRLQLKKMDEYTNEDEEHEEFHIHEGIIIFVHLTPSIYRKLTSIFSTFLNLLKNLIKTSPKTGLGLYLGNCSRKNEDNVGLQLEGIHEIFRLQDLNSDMLSIINRYINNSKTGNASFLDTAEFESAKWQEYFPLQESEQSGEAFGNSLYSMLQQSLSHFRDIPQKTEDYTNRKVFLFTDCYTPYNGNNLIKQKLQSKLRDLNAEKITVYPFLLDTMETTSVVKTEDDNDADEDVLSKRDVSLTEFRELFDFPLNEEDKKYLPAVSTIGLGSLEEKILKHATVKRLLFQCPLIMGDKKMLVRGINPFTTVEWKKVKFYPINGQRFFAKRKAILESGDKEIDRGNVTRAYQIADQYIPTNKDFQEKCLMFGEPEKPILHVIGTRKFIYFNPSYIINKASFMIADEEDTPGAEGSADRFAALYKSLTKKKMMVLCWGMPRKLSYPQFYYLIPTSIVDTAGMSTENYPHALAMIPVPFGNEVRKAPEYISDLGRLKEADESHILDDLIDQAKVGSFEIFPNPSLAWKFKMIEDHIMSVNVPQSESAKSLRERQLQYDEMYQQMSHIRKKIEQDDELGMLVSDLQTRYNRISNSHELKRIAQDSEALDTSNKRTRKVAGGTVDVLNDTKCALYYDRFQLQNCTNDMLRAYIKSKGGTIKIGKNKGEMIANIVEYLTNNQLI